MEKKQKLGYALAGVVVTTGIVFTCFAYASEYLHIKDSGFTQLPISARAIGMGGAFVAVADDYSACYYNPAGLINISSSEIGSMYTDLYGLGLLSQSFIGYVEPDRGMGSGGISWSHLSANLQPERWDYDMVVYSYANYLSRTIKIPTRSWGINLKYLTQNTPYEDAVGYSLDFSYLRKEKKFSLGICFQNIISKINWETGEKDILPVNITAGIAFPMNSNILISTDVSVSPPDLFKEIRIGCEWKPDKLFFIRGGIMKKLQKDGNAIFSLGIGIKTNLLGLNTSSFDYAFTSSQKFSSFGTHYLSFALEF